MSPYNLIAYPGRNPFFAFRAVLLGEMFCKRLCGFDAPFPRGIELFLFSLSRQDWFAELRGVVSFFMIV